MAVEIRISREQGHAGAVPAARCQPPERLGIMNGQVSQSGGLAIFKTVWDIQHKLGHYG
jgi:hypothetical protein